MCTCTCTALIRCSRLGSPSNGQVMIVTGSGSTEFVVGSTARYSCNSGYVLAGRGHLECTSDREGVGWNGILPTCTKVY